jgi:flagellar biosynthetic protein FliR
MGLSMPFVVDLLVREIEQLQFTIHGIMKALGHG